MTSTAHERCRRVLLDGELVDPATAEHLDACGGCRSLAEGVAAVRRLAPTMGPAGAPPPDLADRVILAWRHSGVAARPARRGFGRAVVPRIAAAVAAVAAAAALLGPLAAESPGADLADGLLVSAQRTEDAGTARLRFEGRSEVSIDDEAVTIAFAGVGELAGSRLHYRGLTRVGDAIVPSEFTVVGDDAWTRRRDGTWMHVAEPVGALAPLVLDAGSVLELLRLPKADLALVGQDRMTRTVAFVVTARPGLSYDVVATVGRDDALLRRVTIASAGDGWRTEAAMDLYGLGEPVTIHAPPRADVGGHWQVDRPEATAALFPVG